MSRRLLVACVASASLVIGFLVAVTTGNRALGGVVLLVGGLWCAWQLVRLAGWWRMLIVGAVYVASFIFSHPLGNIIGSWPSVFLVAIITGMIAYFMVPKHSAGS